MFQVFNHACRFWYAIEREVYGEVHERIAETTAQLADLYEARDDLKSARQAREQVLATRKKLHKDGDWRITDAKLAELGLPGFGPEFEVTCENHGGSGLGIVQQWDASAGEWKQITDYIEPDAEVINALIMEDSMAYAAENNIEERCN